ncbi:MAG: hypothetical protein ACRDNG_04265 [Gaiellaceae bacterium]
MRRRLLRPAVLIPAFVLLSVGAGIAYAAWTQLDSGRVDANMEVLDSVPLYPGAREIQRLTQSSSGEDAIPVPDEIVTSALYAPPAEATEADIVAFYVESLEPEWEPRTRVVRASEAAEDGTTPASFRVDFSRDDDCLSLLTYGMAPGHVGEATYALSAQTGDGPCPEPD